MSFYKQLATFRNLKNGEIDSTQLAKYIDGGCKAGSKLCGTYS